MKAAKNRAQWSALIVDDEPFARASLRALLEREPEAITIFEARNGHEAASLIHGERPDVVFLDVQMPGLDGFGVLKKLLDRRVPLPQVVFATAYNQYAVRAFEVNAVDYLLKPFDRKRVLQTIEKAQNRLLQGERADGSSSADTESKLDALLRLMGEQAQAPVAKANTGKVIVRAQSRLLLVDQKEICFAAIDEGTITVVTPTVEGHANCRTIEELQEQLDPEAFWRVHRSFLVNIQHIREVVPWFKSSYQLRMDDPKKTEIPVSRAQTKRLKELFNL